MRLAKLFLFIISTLILISCSSQNSKIIVADYGKYSISMDEFEAAYERNSGGFEKAKNDSIGAYSNFLDLYVNYKMKLRDAEIRGYKFDPELQKELLDYKSNIGSTLYLNNYLIEPGTKRLYDRRKYELRASHMYLLPDSALTDAAVFELGKNLIKRIQNGEDFGALAKQYSKDTYTKDTGGDVYFFTAGQINNAEIEDAVYGVEVGKIYPEPISFGGGYHIIKITDKQLRRAAITIQHILITFADSTEAPDTAKALKTIQTIEKKIKDGSDFGEMARLYSKDKGNAAKDGLIGEIKRGFTVREFDEAAFRLKKGEVSPIVKTQFGFHLIKLVNESELKSFEQEREELKEIYQRIHYKRDYDKFTEKLKKDMSFTLNQATFSKLLALTDTLKINDDYWKSDFQKKLGSLEIFKVNNKQVQCDSLFEFMLRKALYTNSKLNAAVIQDAINQYSSDFSIREKAATYDKENKEFEKLITDYENGMYLFKILEDEVWSKIKVDSANVFSFWDKTKQDYKWNDRVEFKEIFCSADTLINKCYSQLLSGIHFDTLLTKYNQKTGEDKTSGNNGLVETNLNEQAKQANAIIKIGDVSKPFKVENGWSIVKLIKRDSARLKTFDEARAETASQFQEKESKRFEDNYLTKLKNLYNPKIYYDELKKAFKR